MAKIIPFRSSLDREIQNSDNLAEKEKSLVADLDRMTDYEIFEKYGDDLTYNGMTMTQADKKAMLAIIRTLRKEKG